MRAVSRALLAVTVLSVLLPAIALTVGSHDDAPDSTDPVISNSEVVAAPQGSSVQTASTTGLPDSQFPPLFVTQESSTSSAIAEGISPRETADQPGETTHPTLQNTTSTSLFAPSTTLDGIPTTSTTGQGTSPSTSAAEGVPPSVLTGASCPCLVTGTATLVGTVELQGDLVVSGGTLIARPGVDVDGNGFQILFRDGGRADFQGSRVSTWSGTGSNANLTRDINFANMRRIIFHEGAGKSTLGFFAIRDSGTAAMGDYSLHFHRNGDTTRGTIVEGVVVINSRNHAFVPHASHGITFRDTIAMNGKCEAYWWDQPEFQSSSSVNNTNDTTYDHALADGVTNCPGDNRGFRLAAFELGAGKGNIVRDSVARNVSPSHPEDCSGFKWPELDITQPSSWTFVDNASYGSSCNGIFVWQNDFEEHLINGFRGDGIDHGAYVNQYEYRNVDVKFVDVHALGWSITGGRIERVTVFRHDPDAQGGPVVFSDVSIGRFVVNNASDSGKQAGIYVLNNTGLACAEIEYASVVPGTKVIIDGTEC